MKHHTIANLTVQIKSCMHRNWVESCALKESCVHARKVACTLGKLHALIKCAEQPP